MKAVALTHYLPISDPQSLFDIDLPTPAPDGHDLLMRVEAVSVNPVDTKVRAPKPEVEKTPRVLGWDAAGIVEAVGPAVTQSLLIIGGAGGVGSIAIQLARLAGLVVIATASRPETEAWVTSMGAQHVVNHRQHLPTQLGALNFAAVHFIANFSDTDTYWSIMTELIRPQGKIVCIVENKAPIELGLLKSKSATFSWEFMFTRAMYRTPDMAAQGELLNEVAALVDAKKLRTTLSDTLTPINAANLRQAHARLESGRTIGKLVLAGWN